MKEIAMNIPTHTDNAESGIFPDSNEGSSCLSRRNMILRGAAAVAAIGALPNVELLAISALDDTDLEVANDAALALGHWGTTSAEAAVWARLKRFHQEWQGRGGELRATPPYNDPIARATALESTLVNSIATGTNWICGPDKLAQVSSLASPRQQMQVATWTK